MKLIDILKEYMFAKDEPSKNNDLAIKLAAYKIIKYFIGLLSRHAASENFEKFKTDLNSPRLKETINLLLKLNKNKVNQLSDVEKNAIEYIEQIFPQLEKIDFNKKYRLKHNGEIVNGSHFAGLYLSRLDDKITPVFDIFDEP